MARNPLVGSPGWPRNPVRLIVGGIEMTSPADLDRRLEDGSIVQSFLPVDHRGPHRSFSRTVGSDGLPITVRNLWFLVTPGGDQLVTPAGARLYVNR
jgi:hypothetical protein